MSSTPLGWREWVGVFLALATLNAGLILLNDIRDGEPGVEIVANVALGFAIALVATAVWAAWSYLRVYDWPGHPGEPEGVPLPPAYRDEPPQSP